MAKRSMTRKCPRCGFVQPGSRLRCRSCGQVFTEASSHPGPHGRSLESRSLLRGRWVEIPQDAGFVHILGYGLLWVLLLYFGISYVLAPIDRSQIPPTLVHRLLELVDLIFHEAGHVLFMFFGNTLHSLGGSIGQVGVPLLCMIIFLGPYHDPVGAAVCLWWSGQSLISLAPYIDDARAQKLVLLGGITGRDAPGAHDWHVVLSAWDLLDWDHTLARAAHDVGAMAILLAIVWCAVLVVRAFNTWREA